MPKESIAAGPPTSATPFSTERRGAPRATVRLAVRVVSGGLAATYTAENLSAGGVLLVGQPVFAVGTDVRVAIPIGRRFLGMHGRVVRVDSAQGPFALRFVDVPARVQDRVQRLVLSLVRKDVRPPAD